MNTLQRSWAQAVRTVCHTTSPLTALLAYTGDYYTAIVSGESWIHGASTAVINIIGSLTEGHERSNILPMPSSLNKHRRGGCITPAASLIQQ